MVRDPQHLVQRPQVHNKADRQEGARLRVLRAARARQQAHPGALYGQPRAVHAPPQARHHRRAADEGSGQGGEARQTGSEVCLLHYYTVLCTIYNQNTQYNTLYLHLECK